MITSRTFLEDTSKWPKMSGGSDYCCLRKGNYLTGQLGFLLSSNPLEVCLGNIFDGGTGEVKSYDSIEDLLKDGWQVD